MYCIMTLFCFTSQDGSWGCFDELQMLSREAMAMVLDHTHAIMAALRAKQEHCMLGDGEQVTINAKELIRKLSPLVPLRLVAHFVRTGLILIFSTPCVKSTCDVKS